MSPIEETPSRNEEEYFARENADRIKELRARLDAQRDAAERKSHELRCPRCGGHMTEQTRHAVHVEVCDDCGGIFLDKGELEMLREVRESGVGNFVSDLFGLRR